MYGGLMAHLIDYVKEYFVTWLLDTSYKLNLWSLRYGF